MSADEEAHNRHWQHICDMVFRRGYAAAYYYTILCNESAKERGEPLYDFHPETPEDIYQRTSPTSGPWAAANKKGAP